LNWLLLFILPAKAAADSSAAVSLFQNHLLPVRNEKPVIHYTQYDYLVSSILFLSYMVFVWLFISNRKRLNQVIMGLFAGRYANQLSREEGSLGNRVVIFLSTLFVFTMPLFFYQTASYFGFLARGSLSTTFFLAALILFFIYGVKLIIIKMLGFIFDTQKEMKEYIISVVLFCNAVGLFMLPVVVCLAFLKQINPAVFIYGGFAIITAFFLTRLVRGLIIGLNSTRVSKFYLFLYLCTLEIVPLAIMVKLFVLKTT